MGIMAWIDQKLLEQRGHLFPWCPVMFAIGIGAYFLIPVEPSTILVWVICGIGLLLGGAMMRWPHKGLASLGWALALIGLGFSDASLRAHLVGAPVLGWRYYGPIEGRVVAIDRSASDALRLTLDRVVLKDLEPQNVPDRIRISLHGEPATFLPGQRVMTTGHLSPPQGPVEPGGFDFRRHAWFQGLGAIGYTRAPVMTVAPPDGGLFILSVRMAISDRVQAVLPGDIGGFGAAVTTGDRSGVSKAALQSLRDSNLAHLLAISGLHMGLLSGFVFGALRFGLCLIPPLALRWPVRKLAAGGAMLAASAYLALSGGNVSTERAFVMTSVVLIAVLLDRRALSIRAVAVAAMIVLALRPESLLNPGFQMSFAATTALVAVFGVLRDHRDRLPHFISGPVMGVFLSSAVAGFATAPVGAAHFNSLSHFGLVANLISVPVMGILVVPAAVLSALLSLLGAEALGLQIMGQGLRWILWVAGEVASWPGSVGQIKSPGPWVLPVLTLGGLWVILWRGQARLIGVVPMLAAAVLWQGATRPPVLIADSGALVGVMTDAGRALSKPKGAGFIADVWLENDGDGVDQMHAATRWPGEPGRVRRVSLGAQELVHLSGKRAAATVTMCDVKEILVSSVDLPIDGPCRVFDPTRLKITGAMAFDPDTQVWTQTRMGPRLWSQ